MNSMTGFGRGEAVDDRYHVTVEMKSVNHRYLDLNIKMPKKYNAFESRIRNLVKNRIERGKVDLFVSDENIAGDNFSLVYNSDLAQEYLRCLEDMSLEFGLENDIRVSSLSRYPEIFSMEQSEEDEEKLWELLSDALEHALDDFVAHRREEGDNLCRDMVEKLDAMEAEVLQVEARAPQIIRDYQEKLTAKVRELLGDIHMDESRILTEVAILADKICIDEETVRLRSHISTMRQALFSTESGGRKLDFIAQEMNREANTILSKTNDLEVSSIAINLKTEIEKIREQVQNIE